jgi:hypothetical protein
MVYSLVSVIPRVHFFALRGCAGTLMIYLFDVRNSQINFNVTTKFEP